MKTKDFSKLLLKITEYEREELDEKETIELFQELYDIGLVWDLQGHYGRFANRLLIEGRIK